MQVIIVTITAYSFGSVFCSGKTIPIINSTIKLSAESIPSCFTCLTQVRSVVRRADQPHLNPTGPCGQGQRKVMEWAGARWFLEATWGRRSFKVKLGRGQGQSEPSVEGKKLAELSVQ